MTIGILFWVLLIVSFCFGVYITPADQRWPHLGGSLLLYVLLALLGWALFGSPIKG